MPREIAAESDTFCGTVMVSRWRFWFWFLVLAWFRGVCIWLIQWEPVLVRSIVQIVSTTPNILTTVSATIQSVVPAVRSSRLKLICIVGRLRRKRGLI